MRSTLEAYSNVVLAAEATRQWSKNVNFGFGFNLVSQSSKSGFQDYTALDLMARTLIVF